MKFHRFLWQSDTGKIIDYEFTRLVFGVACSPSLAMHAVQTLAERNASDFPLAAAAVRDSSIVDDITTSLETVEQAQLLVRQLLDLFRLGSMEIKKWGSSNAQVLQGIPEQDRAKTVHLNTLGGLDQTAGVMTLGMRWNTADDILTFQMTTPERTTWTPRAILSCFLKIFDPLGL